MAFRVMMRLMIVMVMFVIMTASAPVFMTVIMMMFVIVTASALVFFF